MKSLFPPRVTRAQFKSGLKLSYKGGSMEKKTFAGVPFCAVSPRQAAEFVVSNVESKGSGSDYHFLNAYSLALAENDASYRSCLINASFNFPDGKPISILSRLGTSRLHQVRGPALFENVIDLGRDRNLRHYLLGSTRETLDQLERSLLSRYEGLSIVGSYSPPFRTLLPEEQVAQDELIRKSKADIVWVGLGTPKQDFEAARLRSVGFNAIAVGAAFDFSAGTKREAPEWISNMGFEWLYRFASEPRRLWKRYLIGNAVFIRSVISRGVE